MKLLLLMSLFSFNLYAAQLKYHLIGSFHTEARERVTYIIVWEEEKGRMAGKYQDSLEVTGQVKGSSKKEGREFQVTFNKEIDGYHGMKITTIPVSGAQTTAIPIRVDFLGGRSTRAFKTKAVFQGVP